MDWIKVKVKHAEYEMAGVADNVFRAWIMMMIYIAAVEHIPTQKQFEIRLGHKNFAELLKHFHKNGLKFDVVTAKIMEDVNSTLHKRKLGKLRQRKHLQNETAGNVPTGDALHNAGITEADKIREDKSRVDDADSVTDPRFYFYHTYKKKFKKSYVPAIGKDYQVFIDLKTALTDEQVISLIDKFFASNDEFIKSTGYTVQVFASQVNKLQSDKPKMRIIA